MYLARIFNYMPKIEYVVIHFQFIAQFSFNQRPAWIICLGQSEDALSVEQKLWEEISCQFCQFL